MCIRDSTSPALQLPCVDGPKLRLSTPEGAAGQPRAKANNSANADIQSSPNTREVPPTTVQNLTSRISKLEKIFTDEKATYTAITVGIHSQYFSLYDKIRQLEPGNLDTITRKFRQLSLYSIPQKWLDHHLIPSLNRPQVLVVLSSGLIPTDTTFFCQILPLWYWTHYSQIYINFIHPLPW